MITRVGRFKVTVQWPIIISVRVPELYLVSLFFFHRFHPVKRLRSKSASDSNEPVTKLRSSSRCQYARFFTCLCKTCVPGHFGLRIFCYPSKLHYDVNQRISRCNVPYIGEGISSRPVYEEEKIFVSLSEAIIPQGSEEKKALEFVRYNIIEFIFGPSST